MCPYRVAFMKVPVVKGAIRCKYCWINWTDCFVRLVNTMKKRHSSRILSKGKSLPRFSVCNKIFGLWTAEGCFFFRWKVTISMRDKCCFDNLVGPCALDYTRMKTPDHFWTDPPADELVQRHRIHSSGNHHIPAAHSDSPKRPGLQVVFVAYH